jgi:hypothetical protein
VAGGVWGAFLVNGWIANIALRSVGGGETPQEFRESAVAYLISDGLDETEERFERAEEEPATTRNEDGSFPSYPG